MPDSKSVAIGSKVMRWAVCMGTATLVVVACGKKGPADPPRVAVSTVAVAPQAATVFADYVAQTEAVNTVEIRPRVGGVLEKQAPIEGERVKVGALLFVIDQQPYIAALAQAKAALAQSEAALVQSRRDLGRAKSLSEIDAVSQQELDAAVAKNDANLASVDAGRAAVRTATLNLGYTTITSPINGVMGRAQLRLGGLVTANSTVLTTLYQTDRMYVNFIDPAVDPRTGTLAIRLEVDNPEHLLHAGQFARVQVAAAQLSDAIVLPQRAIQELQGKYYVWIVDSESKAQQRDVQMGPRIGSGWQVQQGLKGGDVVVVDGVQRLKPGSAVNATPVANAPEATGTAAGSRT